jgi:hypothetical protein
MILEVELHVLLVQKVMGRQWLVTNYKALKFYDGFPYG